MDLVFDNSRMIDLLKQRGSAIKYNDQGKVFQIEHLINLEKAAQYNTDVCGVFITFENDSDVKMSQDICRNTKLQIFGKQINIKRAQEPSNYIWENLANTKNQLRFRLYIVMSLLGLILFFAYKLQF